jgi:hypothetical protein
MVRAVHDERDRIVVKLSLPRDALIEFVIRCWPGLGSNLSFPASDISHGGGPRAGAMRRGEVAMIRICAPHRGRWLLWSLNLPLGSAVLQYPQ